jgi:hypothetical protein
VGGGLSWRKEVTEGMSWGLYLALTHSYNSLFFSASWLPLCEPLCSAKLSPPYWTDTSEIEEKPFKLLFSSIWSQCYKRLNNILDILLSNYTHILLVDSFVSNVC